MPDEPVRLRPIEEADLDTLRRFDTDPSSRGPTYRPASAARTSADAGGRRSAGSAPTPASSPSPSPMGPWPGSWPGAQHPDRGGPEIGCLGIGILLFPERRGQGLGTAAQRLLAQYLFATTLANRLQAITNVENIAEQKALERAGFRREGVMRGLAFYGGRWHDGVLYARLRDDR